MQKRKTDAEFKKEVFDLVGDEYTFLEPYIKNSVKIKVKHNKCGNIYKVDPHNFLHGNRCPYCCRKSRRRTNAQFKQEVYDLVGDEYVFLDPYANNKTKLKIKHNKCGNIYKIAPHEFMKGIRCPFCNGNAKKANIQFKKEVENLVGDEYTFIEPYANTRIKLRVKHNKCGNIYKTTPHSFLQGSRCPFCYGKPKKTNAKFKKDVYLQVGDEYTFLDPYVDNKTKLRVKHTKCGNTYEVRPTDFLDHHNRCPYCNSPRGETIIAKILNTFNINYEPQKTFDDLKDKSYLSYDFFIQDQAILIEYQGRQHYQPVDHFGGENQFKLQKKHDKLKADYAKTHNYKLITVPYTEDNFSKIKKYLIKQGLKKYLN